MGAVKSLQDAVNSIPAYIERSAIVLVLVPVCQHSDSSARVCSYASWMSRGWCRVEYAAAVLSRRHVPLMVCRGSDSRCTFLPSSLLFGLLPGNGVFTCCALQHCMKGAVIPCDKLKIKDVLVTMIAASEEHLHRTGEKIRARCLTVFRPLLLTGISGDTPLCSQMSDTASLERLKVGLRWGAEDDRNTMVALNSLLHWAALAGDAASIRALIQAKASIDNHSQIANSEFDVRRGLSALYSSMKSASGTPDAARALLDAKASLSPEHAALIGNGLAMAAFRGHLSHLIFWLDRFPGIDLEVTDPIFGFTAFVLAAGRAGGALEM